MIIKVSEDRTLVAVEMSAKGKDRFYACGSFATCTVTMEEFLNELERNGLIAPRVNTTENQAQGLLEMVWGDRPCGS